MAGKRRSTAEKGVKLRVALGADHGGYSLKNELLARLQGQYDTLDLGAHKYDPDNDYPDFAEAVAKAVASGKAQRGILVCGSGVGACIAANKVPGVRACLCHDTYSAPRMGQYTELSELPSRCQSFHLTIT